MSFRIRCYTLFDITSTGVLNRSKPPVDADDTWMLKRNTQCNFDTVLQVISLRSQPEVIKHPERNNGDPKCFGFLHKVSYYWVFEFEIQHPSVFENGVEQLGGLYSDCENVPMIRILDDYKNMEPFLHTSKELKNIHFEIL
jgi:hypothetical protein